MAKELKVVTTYGQRDSRWAGILLGYNTEAIYSIGNFGCLLTSITNYLNAVGKAETPQTLNDKFKANNGFTAGSGLLIWEVIPKIFSDVKPDFTSARYEDTVPASAISKLRSLIDGGHMVLIEVDFNPSQAGEQMHWVLAYGYTDAGDIIIIDPWTGSRTTLGVYGKVEVCMYSYRSYSLTVASAEELVCDTVSTRDMLVKKATQRDDVCTYLTLPLDPNQTDSGKITSIIGGYKSRITDLGNQLAESQAELTNKDNKISSLSDQVLSEQQLRKDLNDNLNQAVKKYSDVQATYEGQLAQKQSLIEGLQKDKADINIQLSKLQKKMTEMQKDFVKNLSFTDIIRLLVLKYKA